MRRRFLRTAAPTRGSDRPRGFTLIELLVVIAIIAILAAILFPVFAQAKLAAKSAADLSNIKQIAIAGELWKADHDGYLVKSYQNYESGGELTGLNYPGGAWAQALQPYIKNKDIFKSPLDPGMRPRGQSTRANDMEQRCVAWNSSVGLCADWRDVGPMTVARAAEDDFASSYRLNASNQLGATGRLQLRTAVNESALESVSDAILIIPGGEGPPARLADPNYSPYDEVSTAHFNEAGIVCVDNIVNVGYDRTSPQSKNPTRSQRDQGRANYGFADGHAKNMAWRQTWRRLGADVQDSAGQTVTPTPWRQTFSGVADVCAYREGDGR